MGFFEKFKPKNVRKEKDKKLQGTIDDQIEVAGKTDVSIEDYTDEMNRTIENRTKINKEDVPIVAEYSWEDRKQQDDILERFSELNLKYNELAQEFNERSKNLENLELAKRGAERASRTLNVRALAGSSPEEVMAQMRNAEDRVDRLRNRVLDEKIDLEALGAEIKAIQEDIEMIAGLLPDEDLEEGDTMPQDKYPYHLN